MSTGVLSEYVSSKELFLYCINIVPRNDDSVVIPNVFLMAL